VFHAFSDKGTTGSLKQNTYVLRKEINPNDIMN